MITEHSVARARNTDALFYAEFHFLTIWAGFAGNPLQNLRLLIPQNNLTTLFTTY